MLITAVSTFALLWTAGPQLATSLQALTPDAGIEAASETPTQTDGRDAKATETDPIRTVKTPPLDRSATGSVLAEAPGAEPPAEDVAADLTAASETAQNDVQITPEADTARAEILPEPTPRVDRAPETEIIVETPAPIVANSNIAETDWPQIMADARTALAATKTAQGRFYQTNADGSVMAGDFALNRPGKLRFDYDDPVPVLIVADGTTVAIEDSELETIDRVPLAATPLGIILDREIDFDGDVEVLDVRRAGDRLGIELRDAAGEMEGTLTLIFDVDTYALLGWLAVDSSLQTTLVNLDDVETNKRIDPRLFRLDEEEDDEDDR